MKTVNSIIILLLFLSSCSPKEKHLPLKEDDLQETKTDTDSFIRKYYGNSKRLDSVLVLNNKMQRFCKEYYLGNEPIRTEYYNKEGRISEEHYRITGHLDERDKTSYDYYIIGYDSAGNITKKGIQGSYDGINIPVGTWYNYQNGKLIREIYYHNDELGKDYIKYKEYGNDGNLKESYSNNFILYETDSIPLSRQEYLLRTEKNP